MAAWSRPYGSFGAEQVLSVVGILQDEADPMVSVMKVPWAPYDFMPSCIFLSAPEPLPALR